MSMGGGSGGSQQQMGQWSPDVAPGWAQAVSWGRNLVDPSGFGAYKPYTGQTGDLRDNNGQWFGSNPGQRIAGLTSDQLAAAGNTTTFLNQLKNPYQAVNSAIDQTTNTLNGDYLSGPNSNPYSRNNPFASKDNSFIGENPYYNQVKQRGMQDIANNYRDAIAPDLKGQMVLNGTLGGGVNDQLQQRNEMALGKSLTDYGMGMDNQNYDRSAQLQEADLGRQGGLYDSFLNRGSNNYNTERGNQMNMVGAGNGQQGLALQRAQAQMGVGDMFRGYNQDLLNQNYNDTQDQNNQQFKMLDYLTGLMSRASGGVGPSYTQTTSGYSASPYSQLLGGGLLASSLFGK
jgi:hypothetical protein